MKISLTFALLLVLSAPLNALQAQSLEHVIFNGGDRLDYYDPTWGFMSDPGFLRLLHEKLPVDTTHRYDGRNSLTLQWNSKKGGEWGVAVASEGWLPFDVLLKDSLSFVVYSTVPITASQLPVLYLEDIRNWRTGKVKLSGLVMDIPAGRWVNVTIPTEAFKRVAYAADLTRIKTIFFGQGVADGEDHTLFVNDLKVFGSTLLDRYHFIVVVGSSTRASFEPDDKAALWVNRFRRDIGAIDTTFQVIDLEVPGYTTYRILPTVFRSPVGRASSDLGKNINSALEYRPNAIIVNVASEDVACGYSITEQLNNYDSLFAFAKERGISLWITTTQPRNFPGLAMRAQLRAVRDSLLHRPYGTHVIDFWADIADSSGGIRKEFDGGDGVRLNTAGQAILSARLISAIRPEVLSK